MATLTDLMSTPERKKTLDYLLLNPGRRISVRETSRAVGVNGGFVSKYLKKLVELGLLSKKNEVNLKSPLARAVKTLLNIERLEKAGVVRKSRAVYSGELLGVGVYGSWARGTNTLDSDLDLWVKLKNYGGVAKNAKILKEIKNALGCDVNIEVFHPAKIVELRGKDITFYHALVFESIVMWGDGVES